MRCIKTFQTSRIDKINVWNRWVSLGLKALLEPGAANFERLFDSAQIERNRCKKNPKTKRLFCLLPQEPDNLSSLRAAKNRTDATQEHRRLQSSGTDARKIQKKKRFFCLLPQEPTRNNFRPMRATKNRTDRCHSRMPQLAIERNKCTIPIQKPNASATCCRKSLIFSDRCGKKQDICHSRTPRRRRGGLSGRSPENDRH